MIRKTLETSFELDTEELAKEFCEMDCDSQAAFFGYIALLLDQWKNPLPIQLKAISESKMLSLGGRRVMRQIGEYAFIEAQPAP